MVKINVTGLNLVPIFLIFNVLMIHLQPTKIVCMLARILGVQSLRETNIIFKGIMIQT